mgnify:CR=1 FL=1
MSYKCFNCKDKGGQVYASAGHWLCSDCWSRLVKEKIVYKKAKTLIKKYGKKERRKNERVRTAWFADQTAETPLK